MSAPVWEPVVIHKDEHFEYVLSFEPEMLCMETHFKTECEWTDKEYVEIEDYYWFCAVIKAKALNISFASISLGCNCYKSIEDVLGDGKLENILSGYGKQLVDECKTDANAFLNSIKNLGN